MERRTAVTLRATALTVIALLVAAVTWRLRPSAPGVAAAPDSDVVLGCAWLAWALAGYLAVAVAATALARVLGSAGVAATLLTRLAPASLRRLVDATVAFSVAAAVLGSAAPTPAIAATTNYSASSRALGPAAPRGALDWPGLTDPARPVVHHSHHPPSPPATSQPPRASDPQPRPPKAAPHHHADVGLVTGGHAGPPASGRLGSVDVVVHRGDSLWRIAARHLASNATRPAITAAWHEWYAANRHVVGANPNLIYPGQRLRQPPAHEQGSKT